MDASLSTLSGVFAQRYSIEKTIGRGATASVYLARDSATDRPVAIKVLKPELAETIGGGRFLREIRLTQGLHHPRILPVLDSGEFEGKLYFVLPYMDGGTLRDRLVREHQLPLREAVEVTCTVADALAHAHQQGYVHRDVKPENILLSNGEVCLADFGIARAIERSIEDGTTSTGIARGTAAYMSPEQASGAHEYDGRSDIYSLGCVLYELIAGVPAFIGPTPEAVIAQRFVHPPRDLKVYRRNVPEKVDAAIRRAMQLAAADRFRNAKEFANALRAITPEEFEKADSKKPWWEKAVATRGRRAAVVAAMGFAGAALFTSARVFADRYPTGGVVRADTTRLVLFPLENSAPHKGAWRDDDLLRQGIARWRGLEIVDEFQVAEALKRVGTVQSASAASTIANSLGALRYIRGRLTPFGSRWRVYVGLYDVGNSAPLHVAASEVPADPGLAAQAFGRLADSLLLRGAAPDSTLRNEVGSRSLPAVQSLIKGQNALALWDLERADAALRWAIYYDRGYTRANLLAAQVGAWLEIPRSRWTPLAERAVANSGELGEREKRIAAALVLLGHGEFSKACDDYESTLREFPNDFAAQFGLGQCRALDRAVVPDATSPSGWRYRSSVGRAMREFKIAFEQLPAFTNAFEGGAFERLRNLLIVSNDLRPGRDLSDGEMFYSRPSWIRDSLALIPYPWRIMFAGDSSTIPAGYEKALAKRREDFREIATKWLADFPNDPRARHLFAISLELSQDPTAIDTLRAARASESDTLRIGSLAAEEVLLLIKFGVNGDLALLRRARALADSLVARRVTRGPRNSEVLAAVYAVIGRCSEAELAARQMVSPEGTNGIGASLLADGYALGIRVAIGCPLREVTPSALSATIAREYEKRTQADREQAEQMLLMRPVVLSPSLDRTVTARIANVTDDALVRAALAGASRDTLAMRTWLNRVDRRVDPGAPTPDFTLARAQLWLQLGEWQRASRILDAALTAIRSYDPDVLADPVNAGALMRAMSLRAELAAKHGDQTTAQRWRTVVQIFSANADKNLQGR